MYVNVSNVVTICMWPLLDLNMLGREERYCSEGARDFPLSFL